MQPFTPLGLWAALRQHWPYYLTEATGLGLFVALSCLTAVFFNHPAAWGRQWLGDNERLHRAATGAVMALVLVLVSYNAWGKRLGAHINPAVTVGFWQLGSMRGVDAVWYIVWQFDGERADAGAAAPLVSAPSGCATRPATGPHAAEKPQYPDPQADQK